MSEVGFRPNECHTYKSQRDRTVWWILLVITILLPVGSLLLLAFLSTLGLEDDQERV